MNKDKLTPDAKELFDELVTMGKGKGFLYPANKMRTWEIGEKLAELGGGELLQSVYVLLKSNFNNERIMELEAAWGGLPSFSR